MKEVRSVPLDAREVVTVVTEKLTCACDINKQSVESPHWIEQFSLPPVPHTCLCLTGIDKTLSNSTLKNFEIVQYLGKTTLVFRGASNCAIFRM